MDLMDRAPPALAQCPPGLRDAVSALTDAFAPKAVPESVLELVYRSYASARKALAVEAVAELVKPREQ